MQQYKLIETLIRYEDGSKELLIITAKDFADAETQAEAWVNYKKEVKDISALREVPRRPGRTA